jgi:ATP-dependent DNA helicase RecQ
LDVTPSQILKDIFGFSEFRPPQNEVISHALSGGHSLVLMPTGQGKSLCFQVPGLILPGMTLVISPLIALMKDQVDQAVRRGIKASFVNSSLRKDERENRYRKMAKGEYKIMYVTPERFRKKDFLEALKNVKVSLLAIDEAHCISEWGHDFRPDYTRVGEFRELLGGPPTMALTATATPLVQKDIVKQLGLRDTEVRTFFSGIERPNLRFSVHDVHGMDEKVRGFVGLSHHNPGPTIIYFSLISTLSNFSRALGKLGFKHVVYHGQVNDQSRRQNQDAFLGGDSALILATPAFGLGIDKPDIRNVFHAEVPGSLEAYYQEAGRSGRDGKPSECVLFYDQDDVSIQMDFIKWAHPDPGFIRSIVTLIERNEFRWKAEGADFLREQMNFFNSRDFRVETAINLLERWDILQNGKIVSELTKELLDEEKAKMRLKGDQQRLLEMVNYVSKSECRVQSIHKYFGIETTPACGQCDLCMNDQA